MAVPACKVQFVNYFDNTSTKPSYINFRNDYVKSYGNEPSFAAYLTYEAITVLAGAIKGSGSAEPSALAAYIKQHPDFQGLEGSIKFDSYGDVDRQIFL